MVKYNEKGKNAMSIWYTAHYGSWRDPHGVCRVEFNKPGEEYKHITGTYNRKEAFCKAQETANETGKVVTVMKERPCSCGTYLDSEKVYPMRGKIKFVRVYKLYREDWYDVVYHSGRVVTYLMPDLPTTVERFIESSVIREEQHDKYHGAEMLYF